MTLTEEQIAEIERRLDAGFYQVNDETFAHDDLRSLLSHIRSTAPAVKMPTRELIAQAAYDGGIYGVCSWRELALDHADRADFLKRADAILALLTQAQAPVLVHEHFTATGPITEEDRAKFRAAAEHATPLDLKALDAKLREAPEQLQTDTAPTASPSLTEEERSFVDSQRKYCEWRGGMERDVGKLVRIIDRLTSRVSEGERT